MGSKKTRLDKKMQKDKKKDKKEKNTMYAYHALQEDTSNANASEVSEPAVDTAVQAGGSQEISFMGTTQESHDTAPEPTAEKEEAVVETYFEVNGDQILSESITQRIMDTYQNNGCPIGPIKSLRIYLNLNERRAYYVINEEAKGEYIEF